MDYAVTGEMTQLIKTEGEVTTLAQQNAYDHNGIRINRTENGTARDYYYDNGVVAFTKDGETITTANILSEDSAAVGTYRGEDYHTYLKDMQGSTTNIVSSDNSLAAAYDYSDFGETEELTGSSFDNQICYTGGIYDKSTELYYLNARYYDPSTGRFISQDTYRGTVDDPSQWHLYAYCANNPINYVDPSGHASIKWEKQDTYKAHGNRRYTKTYTQWHTGGFGKLRVINRFRVYKKKIAVRLDECEAIVVKTFGTAEYDAASPISTAKKANEIGEKINVSAVFKRTKSFLKILVT